MMMIKEEQCDMLKLALETASRHKQRQTATEGDRNVREKDRKRASGRQSASFERDDDVE